MSQTQLTIKCIHCGSDDTFACLANPEPNKIAYRCRKCTTSWSDSKLDKQGNVSIAVEKL